MNGAYYNEHDPYSAQWLRNLIDAGHIAPGVVDERSIEDVSPDELSGFAQCHFFAGIGVWSAALRAAGWPDDRPVWTGSCPCQPFSAAGKGGGFDDERHLWPAWFHLIGERRPEIVLGEQVASRDGLAWLDLVSADMEGTGYAGGAVDLCAAGVGAPHIRQRLFFGWADGVEYASGDGRIERWAESSGRRFASGCRVDGLADTNGRQCDGITGSEKRKRDWQEAGREQGDGELKRCKSTGRLADADNTGLERRSKPGRERSFERAVGSGFMAGRLADANGNGTQCQFGNTQEAARFSQEKCEPEYHADVLERGCADHRGFRNLRSDGISDFKARTGPVNGVWRDADWLHCRDGKWRPVEPGTFPLAHGIAGHVGRLRAYGNAINIEAAKVFIEAFDATLQSLRNRVR